MQFIEEKIDDIYIFKLGGRLDSNTSLEFEKNITQTIEDGAIYIIIDFENIEFISSAGLRAILSIIKILKSRKGKIVLCSMTDYVKEVFKVSGFDKLLTIVLSRDDAIQEFSSVGQNGKAVPNINSRGNAK